jgi:Domain of unknown function (DUF4337)
MVLEPNDAAEQLQEAVEERAEREEQSRFRTRAAVAVGVLAMLLAIASLGGENAAKAMVNANILASDTFAFYQAKTIRQTDTQLAADQLRVELQLQGTPASPEARQTIEQLLAKYQGTIARYESEPDPNDPANPLKGEGKQQLLAQARAFQKDRERAEEEDPNFDYSTSLFQIAIVLASVSIVMVSRRLLALALAVGGVALLLLLNGFFLVVALPFGD